MTLKIYNFPPLSSRAKSRDLLFAWTVGRKGGPPATDSREFATAVTFIADPHGEHARAVFSGACIKTGEYGHTAVCSTQLVPNPDVTVTYECHAGSHCFGPH